MRTYSLGPKNPAATATRIAITLLLCWADEFKTASVIITGNKTARMALAPYRIFSALGFR